MDGLLRPVKPLLTQATGAVTPLGLLQEKQKASEVGETEQWRTALPVFSRSR